MAQTGSWSCWWLRSRGVPYCSKLALLVSYWMTFFAVRTNLRMDFYWSGRLWIARRSWRCRPLELWNCWSSIRATSRTVWRFGWRQSSSKNCRSHRLQSGMCRTVPYCLSWFWSGWWRRRLLAWFGFQCLRRDRSWNRLWRAWGHPTSSWVGW